MANLDTAAKRLSGINVSCPWRGFFPLPDGAITSAGDRQTAAYFYSGINPSVAANQGSGTCSGTGTIVGTGYRLSYGGGTCDGVGNINGSSYGTASTSSGVRRARFLRRAPRLPWEEQEEVQEDKPIIVAPPRKQRIKMPAIEAIRSNLKPIPIEAVKTIDAPIIVIPELGAAHLQQLEDDEDDDWLWLI